MTILRLASFLAAGYLAVACSPAQPAATAMAVVVERADGRSDASLNDSLDSMRSKMTTHQVKEFTDALVRIAARMSEAVLGGGNGDFAAMNRALREKLHGMSAAEILVEGAER